MNKEFLDAIVALAEEKNIEVDVVFAAVEASLAAAYRKDFGTPEQNIKAEVDRKTGKFRLFDVKEVVDEYPDYINEEIARREAIERGEEVAPREKEEYKEGEEPRKKLRELILRAAAKKIKKDAKLGDIIRTEITPPGSFGRIAAQTAKQVIIQRLREAERDAVFADFKDKQGEVMNAIVQRIEGNTIFVDLGTTSGILFPSEKIRGERYSIGQRIRVYIKEVREGKRGPEVIVSRACKEFVHKLFELEVPEIYAGTVQIKAIAREAGSRTKLAVATDRDEIDPVGSCVGQRGTRVQTVIGELAGEKIDIIEWDADEQKFIENALSPAKISSIELDKESRRAKVLVVQDQLSLAIGKDGQNVRLASKLADYEIDIVEADSPEEKDGLSALEQEVPAEQKKASDSKKEKDSSPEA